MRGGKPNGHKGKEYLNFSHNRSIIRSASGAGRTVRTCADWIALSVGRHDSYDFIWSHWGRRKVGVNASGMSAECLPSWVWAEFGWGSLKPSDLHGVGFLDVSISKRVDCCFLFRFSLKTCTIISPGPKSCRETPIAPKACPSPAQICPTPSFSRNACRLSHSSFMNATNLRFKILSVRDSRFMWNPFLWEAIFCCLLSQNWGNLRGNVCSSRGFYSILNFVFVCIYGLMKVWNEEDEVSDM